MSSVISIQSSRFITFYSCITKDFGNCFKSTGNNWEAIRRAYYDTPMINAVSGVTVSPPAVTVSTTVSGVTVSPPDVTVSTTVSAVSCVSCAPAVSPLLSL